MERSLSMELVRVTEAAALNLRAGWDEERKMKQMMQQQQRCGMYSIQFR